MNCKLVDTATDLKGLIDTITALEEKAKLFVDLEGNNLSRHGTLSLITVLIDSQESVHLVDVTTLKQSAFTIAASDGTTLKDILESKSIIKVFFDIRNDSDALFGLYNVKVDGIEDLQLMELASRTFAKRHINGLAKCIERNAQIGYAAKSQWRKVKEKGRTLFAPECGGSYSVFDRRPLDDDIEIYCCQDVTLMPHLYDLYNKKLCDAWWSKIKEQTKLRISESQRSNYNGKGQHRALAPPGWLTWRPTYAEQQCKKFLTGLPLGKPADPEIKHAKSSSPVVEMAALESALKAVDLQGADAGEANP